MGEAIAALEAALKSNPNHPGAVHFYIHAVEASTGAARAESYADRLGALMPGAGHLVHMPSHIYYRLGRYRDALEANRRAVAVDEAYFAKVKAEGMYHSAYYPHNVHFLMAAAQMAGDGASVISSAHKIDFIISADAAREMPGAQQMKAAQYFAHAQFSAPETVLSLPDPGDTMPYLKAMWHYARGVARAAQRDINGAQREVQAIASLRAASSFSALTNEGVPVPDVLRIAKHVVEARMAQAQNNLASATEHFREAVALQDKLPYMEPPYWYYPVRQSLGAALLLAGDVDGAERAFRESLARAPNSGWSLYGLREVYEKRGDRGAVNETEELLQRAWVGSREQLQLARL
jgi:tetratricopeptide (TPR) repeat protein